MVSRVDSKPAPAALSDNFNVRDFGALGDGKTDDTAAFQKALDAAGKRTCIVDVPLVPLSRLQHGIHVIDWGTHDRLLEPAAGR